MSESTSVSMGLKAITDKDELVKQHMKIAEEAIAGWERAEAEFADMKEKYEAVMEQKLATEDRVSHLDGALKECMKQLRLVREEQEQKIHEAVMKKTSEWERSGSCPDTEAKLHQVRDELCVALEENRTLSKSLQKSEETIAEQKACSSRNIADLEAKLRDSRNEVSKVIAEKMALSKSLQECEETMSELRHGKARLEGENSRLKIRLAAVEKENLRFKSELRTISKDLELKIDQDRMNKKSMQESRKKIANLEEECQRLRALVTAKKRTQSNTDSAKAQGSEMPSSAEKLSRRRQSPSRRSTSSLSFKTDSDVNGDVELLSEVESDHGNIKGQNRFLTDKVMVMALEAEAKPMLVRKGSNKYSIAEEQLENSSYSCCSEPGTTFRKNNSTASSSASLHTSLISLDIMDDFAEMEKLASLSDSPQGMESEGEMSVPKDSSSDANILDFYEKKTNRGKRGNLEASESLEEYLKEKPEETESQFPSFPGKQESGKITMNHLEELLAMKQGNGIMHLGKSTEIARLATTEEKKSVAAELKDHVNGDGHGVLVYRAIDQGDSANVWSMTSSVSLIEQQDESSDKGLCNNAGAELASAVRKVLEIVESIGQSDYSFPYSQWASGPNNEHDNDEGEGDSPKRQWRCSGLHACVESLINLCNTLIQGKVDIIDFIAEIASALDWLVGLICTPLEKSASTNSSQVKGHVVRSKGVIDHSSDSDLTSAGYSPSQTMHNTSYLEEDYNATGSQAQDIVVCDHSSISNLSFRFSASSVNVKEDISELPSENGSIKPSLEAELKKNARLDGEILRLRLVNDQLERNHESTMEKLTELHSQVDEANRKIHKLTHELMESQKWSAELKAELHEALDRKQFLQNSFEELEREKNGLESELRKAKENVEVLQLKAVNLQKDLDAEIKWHKEAEMRYFELQKLHTEERRLSSAGSWSDLEGARLRKEQEIAAAAEKLSECQQTILDLGKQLKALGAPKNLLAQPLHSSSPVLLHQKASGGEDSVLYEMIDSDDLEGASSTSMNGREQRQDIMVMKPLKVPHSGADYEEDDDIRRRWQANGRYGRQAQSLDMCNNGDSNNYNGSFNRFPSPIQHDMSQESAQSSSSDVSPMRSSPSKFLGLRSKSNVNSPSEQVSGNYAENNENGEKHGSSSGLSRFFGGRTRSGH